MNIKELARRVDNAITEFEDAVENMKNLGMEFGYYLEDGTKIILDFDNIEYLVK